MKRKLTTKASYAATHLCGICAAMAVLMCLAFTSCSKDYPKLVKERVEQYRKEGKWVLSYSKNATEDGHFIVYADEKTQTIVVDSIDGMETANLNALTEVSENMTFADVKIFEFHEGGKIQLKLQNRKFFIPMNGYGNLQQVEKLRGYKNKYMIMEMAEPYFAVLFLESKKVYTFGQDGSGSFIRGRQYTGTDYKIRKNGDLDIRMKFDFDNTREGLPAKLPCTYVVTFGSNGNIKKKADHVTCCGVKVPVEAFEYMDGNFEPYLEEMKRNMNSGDLQDDFNDIEDESENEEWSAEEPEETSSPSNNTSENNVAEERQSEPQPAEQQEVSNSNRQPFKLVPVDEEPSRPAEDNKIFDVVDERPSFPGGDAALMQWLSSNIKYPVIAAENGIQGRVIVQFVISRTGVIRDAKVLRGVDPALDREAVRVVRSMPRWTPGKQNNTPVNVRYTLPITFRLQ